MISNFEKALNRDEFQSTSEVSAFISQKILTGELSYTSLTGKDFAAFSRHKKIQRQF
ncbi:hypothetical protein SAMN04489801_4835 [Pseudomonas mandelii]|uniref:Uncharacterized protein n=1 Tax=Pseudomonas mandelii TaxID=75612 RepID=A0ABY0VW61_9PSED|nr:hypothetical protein SAMN04489801_4835 [Pseudomonas mandelii]